ncbi:DUF1877 family protein [Amycolatopsis sp. lyj-108]|uniref:DUF1877 family protein n=1 Tax=Amycolatopsis sp. lyj-108 TaxID=2789286 RepID=UPI003979A446
MVHPCRAGSWHHGDRPHGRSLTEKPERYWEYAEKAVGTERAVDIDKAWHALWFLVGRAGFEVDFVLGGTLLGESRQ